MFTVVLKKIPGRGNHDLTSLREWAHERDPYDRTSSEINEVRWHFNYHMEAAHFADALDEEVARRGLAAAMRVQLDGVLGWEELARRTLGET